jgi:glycosyltransferase involved in cell wall biosynthesis
VNDKVKILQIGNYPPPMCGWGIQTKLVTEELRRRGHVCQVLKINENRRVKDSAYIDVQGGWDYLCKVVAHAFRGYRLNVHVNGMSKKGYVLAMIAALAGRTVNRPALLTFHGGLSQYYFPRHDSWRLYQAFRILFRLAGGIACDSTEIKQAIEAYGIRADKITAIATFSAQYLSFTPEPLPEEVIGFLERHGPVFFSYVSFRPEYRLDVVRECMSLYRKSYPDTGFIWLGFPAKEFLEAQKFVETWTREEKDSLLLLGNLTHDEFLTLMTRCFACLRTPACDGVAASVLEALTLGVPVVASENGRRPAGVITYKDTDAADMCAKLVQLTEDYSRVKQTLGSHTTDDNVGLMADWLAGRTTVGLSSELMHANQ